MNTIPGVTFRPIEPWLANGLQTVARFMAWLPPQDRMDLGRFFATTELVEGCWLWQGEVTANGYGRFSTTAGRTVAHRWIYERLVGPIPEGRQLDHLCRVRACVNPNHLEPVTPAEHHRRTHPARTHCPRGHPYDEVNTRRYRGRRYCRACNNNGGSGRLQEAKRVLDQHARSRT